MEYCTVSQQIAISEGHRGPMTDIDDCDLRSHDDGFVASRQRVKSVEWM